MINPGLVDNDPEIKRYQDYTMAVHQKKLKIIKEKGSHLVDGSSPDGYRRNAKSKSPVPAYISKEKEMHISKNNQILLDKLSAISQKKPTGAVSYMC